VTAKGTSAPHPLVSCGYPASLKKEACKAIADPANEIFFSAASVRDPLLEETERKRSMPADSDSHSGIP